MTETAGRLSGGARPGGVGFSEPPELSPPIWVCACVSTADCWVFHGVAGNFTSTMGGLPCVDAKDNDYTGQADRGLAGRDGRYMLPPHGEVRPAHSEPGGKGDVRSRTAGGRVLGGYREWDPFYVPPMGL